MKLSLRWTVGVLLLTLLAPALAEAQPVCRKGKPCGNTCIARNKTCRVGPGTARAAPRMPTSSTVTVPEGATFVASSRGQVYYWVGCAAWRRLAITNLRYFQTRAEAEAAGYRASTTASCRGPEGAGETGEEAAGSFSGPGAAPCTVSSIVDGDTLDCADGRRIRLLLIDAPEMGQGAYGAVAKQGLESLASPGSQLRVELDVELQDRYGRTLAYLYGPDGSSVNEALVRMGLAVVSVYPPNVRHVDSYRAALEEAREAGRGLWALGGFACEPADYRAGRCEGLR